MADGEGGMKIHPNKYVIPSSHGPKHNAQIILSDGEQQFCRSAGCAGRVLPLWDREMFSKHVCVFEFLHVRNKSKKFNSPYSLNFEKYKVEFITEIVY